MSSYHRAAFVRAWDAFLAWEEGTPPPAIDVRGVPVSIDRMCSMLWLCSDALPADLAGALAERAAPGRPLSTHTYSGGARVLRFLYNQALLSRADHAAESPRSEAAGDES